MKKLSEHNNIDLFDDGYILDKEDISNLCRLQNVLLQEENIIATLEECQNAWQRYSSDLCASWLFFPDNDDDILRHISSSDFFTTFEDYLTNPE